MSEETSDNQLQVEILPTNEGSDVQQMRAETPDLGFVPLQDFMGIANPDDKQKEQLGFVWNYFAKGRDRAETLNEIKNIRDLIAPPEVGETYLHKLFSYTRLLENERSINKEKQAYKK